MSHQSPPDITLYRAVDEVLHYLWDPIGVANIPEARNEYYGYLPGVFALLMDGGDEDEIARHLGAISTERMGLSANADHDRTIARQLLAWKVSVGSQ